MERMKKLAAAGIELHLQVVLCKNVNDGKELDRTIGDVVKLFPQAESMSIVPVGLTKYREGLYEQEPFTKEDAEKVLHQIEGWQKKNSILAKGKQPTSARVASRLFYWNSYRNLLYFIFV